MLRYLTSKAEGNNNTETDMSKYETPDAKPPTSVKMWACDVCKATFPDYDEACRHEETCRQEKEQEQANAQVDQLINESKYTTVPSSQAKSTQRWSCDVCHEQFDDYDEALRHEEECAREKQQQRKQEAKSNGTAASKPVHSFFGGTEGTKVKEKNSKKRSKAETVADTEDDNDQVASKPRKQKTTKKQTEPTKRSRSTKSEKSSKAATASKPPPAKKKRKDTQSTDGPPLAHIFGKRGASQIMAEHKAAEFAAKRRADAERERQRQKRRNEQQQQKLKESADKALQNAVQNKSMIPAEVRFPVPSHVVSTDAAEGMDIVDSDTCWIGQDSLSVAQRCLGKTLRHPSPDTNNGKVDDCIPLLPTNAKPLTNHDPLQKALSDLLTPPKAPLNDTEAWTDKYSIQRVPDDLCGSENKTAANELLKFVDEWKLERGKAHERRAERQQALLKKKKKRRYRDDDDIWEDSDEESGLCSVCLLTGPPGSGKTSLVHAVARQSECVVLEINTTERRGGTALKNAIEEATQSDSSLDMLKKNQMAVDADPLVDSDDEQDDAATKGSSIIVVLIDEVDLIFEEEGDAGFWNAMSTLTKKAKCPIFLTANTVPDSLLSSHIRYLHLETSRPRPMECASKMKRILKKEGLNRTEKFTESVDAKQQLSLVALLCKCDLRRIINELQLFATSHPRLESSDDDSMTGESYMAEADPSQDIPGPTICGISPKEVSPYDLSLVTIRGKHFSSDASVKIYFGDQVSPAVKVLNDTTILAVSPPCSLPAGVTDSGIDERTGRESRTTRFAPVSVKLHARRKMLSRSDAAAFTTNELCDGTSCTSIGRQWNIEYAFPPPRYGVLQDLHDESIEEELGSDEPRQTVVPSAAPVAAAPQRTFTKEEAEAVLDKVVRDWDVTKPGSENSSESNNSSARHLIRDEDTGRELHVLSNLTRVSSDAAVLDDGIEFGGVPFLSGVVLGFGSSLVNDGTGNTVGGNDQKKRKLLRDANARPPNFERLYALGWNEDGCFFGSSEAYSCYPNTNRERQLLSLGESLDRGLGLPLSSNAVPVDAYDDDSSNQELASNSLSETIKLHEAPRHVSEEDMFVRSCRIPSMASLPGDLRRHVQESGCPRWKQVALSSLSQTAEDKAHRLTRMLSDLLEEDCDPSANRLLCELARLSETTIVPLQDRMNESLFLDYVPMLCNIAMHERAEEHAFQQLLEDDPETAAEMTGRRGRTTRRNKSLERRHYFVTIRSCSEDSVANAIGSNLAKEVMHYGKK